MTTLKPKADKTHTRKTGGINKHTPMSKQAMFSKVSSRANDIIDELFEIAFSTTRQPAVKLGALKTLINKILPDLKVQEIVGDEDRPVSVIVLPEEKLNERQVATASRPTDGGSDSA